MHLIPWFCAFSWIMREELEFSAKLLSNSLFSDRILEFVSLSRGKEDAAELPLAGVSWFLAGVFSCCHENTDEEAWCRAISLWLKELWGWGWFIFCVQRKKRTYLYTAPYPTYKEKTKLTLIANRSSSFHIVITAQHQPVKSPDTCHFLGYVN